MGMDYKGPEPDPHHWAQCSCGEFKTYGPDQKTVVDLIKLHAMINKDTHFAGGGVNGYFLHIPPKPNWWKRTFGKHVGRDNE
jgi:hypothetical protein